MYDRSSYELTSFVDVQPVFLLGCFVVCHEVGFQVLEARLVCKTDVKMALLTNCFLFLQRNSEERKICTTNCICGTRISEVELFSNPAFSFIIMSSPSDEQPHCHDYHLTLLVHPSNHLSTTIHSSPSFTPLPPAPSIHCL